MSGSQRPEDGGRACGAGAPRSPAPVPHEPVPRTTGAAPPEILQAAESAIGVPYRYGGASRAGFDCSGLTQFAYRAAGILIPRTAAAQQRDAVAVARDALQPGDLVFFATGHAGIDHVGIYAGDGRFVHAPSSGRRVSFGDLADPWYASSYAGAGRFWSPGEKTQALRAAP